MDAIIKPIEKMKPFFDKVARNKYLKAIKDGFISSMPIILFSSIFLLIAYVPNVFGFYWSKEIEAIIMKPYNYSMGILAIAGAGLYIGGKVDSLQAGIDLAAELIDSGKANEKLEEFIKESNK